MRCQRVSVFSVGFIVFLTQVSLAVEIDAFGFFRATEDKREYIEAPTKYDRLTVTGAIGKHEYYIEKQASHIISRRAVESVTVQKTKEFGKRSGDTRDSGPFLYNLTFRLAPEERKNFIDFVNKNMQQVFHVQIGGRSIGVLRFEWPFEPGTSEYVEFTIYPGEHNADSLKTLLSPFSDKVIWK